jgi:hypothetical protein
MLIGVAILIILILVVFVFIYGGAWVSSKLLPWFSIFTWVAFALVVFAFLPFAIPKRTRGFASVAILISSYVFGATLWMEGFLLTLALWGVWAVIVGLFIAGIDVVPIAMLAALLKGMWLPLVELILLAIATFGCRFGALSLAESLDV